MDRTKKEIFDVDAIIPKTIDLSEIDLVKATQNLDVGSKYKIKPPRQLKSQFEVKQEAKQKALKARKLEEAAKKETEKALSLVNLGYVYSNLYF